MSHTFGSRISYGGSETFGGYGQYAARQTIAPALAARMGKPSARLQNLVTLTVGKWLRNPTIEALSEIWSFEIPTGGKVTGVFIDGGTVGLTEVAYSAAVEHPSTAVRGTWSQAPDRRLIVVPPTGKSIFDNTYRANIAFRCSRLPSTVRDIYWEPRVTEVPNLSLRIEPRFSGVGQIGGGKITLNNADGFFDGLDSDEYQWDAGSAVLEFGIDLPDSPLDEADYQRIGTWRIESVQRTDTQFHVNVKEIKTRLENKIPYEVYTRADYPNIPNEWIGKPIPFAWGRHFSIDPAPINPSQRRFKVASHRIRSFDGVKVRGTDDTWREVTFESTDVALAEFTLSAADYTGDEEVAVDFSGRVDSEGRLMENAAEVMADLLNYVGETEFDWESFAVSARALHVGYDRFGNEVVVFAPAIYLDEQQPALDVASEINRIASSFLFADFAGRWRYGVFDAVQAKELDPMAGSLIRKFSETEILEGTFRKNVESDAVFSKVKVSFAPRPQEEWTETIEQEREPHQLLHGISELFLEEREIGLSKRSDAEYWAQRLLVTEAEPLTRFYFSVPWVGFFLLPGDKLHLEHTRHGINAVLELLSVSYDLVGGKVAFECGNQRGWNDSFGFWVDDIAETDEPGPPKLPPGAVFVGANMHVEDGFILQWSDASGNNNHATQSSPANQPTWKHNAVNGRPSIVFSGDTTIGIEPFAYWTFEDSVFPILDRTSGGRNLTRLGTGHTLGVSVTGSIGLAIRVPRVGAGVGCQVADDAGLDLLATDFTLRGRMRLIDSIAGGGSLSLLQKYNANSGYALEASWNGAAFVPVFTVANGTGLHQISGAAGLALNTWVHVVATYKASTETMNLYVNGVLEGTLAGVGAVVANTLALKIAYAVSVASEFDEIGIWQNEWSLAQVAADFQGLTFPNTQPQYLNLPNLLAAATESEIFAVVKADNDPGSATGHDSALWNFGTAAGEKYPSSDNHIYEQFGTNALKDAGDPVPALTGWRVYNVSSKASEYKVRVDNTEILSSGVNTVAFTSAPTIGTGGGTWFNGEIAALLIWPRVLTAAERDDVVKILSTQFNLGLSFPGSTALNVTPPPAWDLNWTDAQANAAKQNSGYWTQTANTVVPGVGTVSNDIDFADINDARSFWPSRWW